MAFLLLSLLGLSACSDASGQDGPVRYYDFDFVAEYLSDDQGGFRYSYLGHAGPHQEDSSARWLNLIHLAYEEGEWAETDTLSVPVSNDQLDKLFALAAALFDLGGTQNVAPHPIPPPPLLNHGQRGRVVVRSRVPWPVLRDAV